jgi:predicted phosphodiesterase
MGRSTDFSSYADDVKEMMAEGMGRGRIAKALNITTSKAQRWMAKVLKQLTESETEALREAARVARSRQKSMDKNRVREKVLRESFRVENAVEEYNKELTELLKNNKFSKLTKTHNASGEAVGVIQVSDIHFNELIDIQNVNKCDFEICAKRFKLLAERAKVYFKSFGIGNVLIAMTGDMMNSDRRLDELLNMATNRSKATFVSVDILQQFIIDLNKDFDITIAYVTGNESRIPKDVGWSEAVATDNYDTTIFNMLKYMFIDAPGVTFVDGDPIELQINVNGKHFLLLHGNSCIKSDIEKSVAQIKGRYAAKGICIDYVIFGHMHSARIGDGYARSSSMAGANAYSEQALNLTGRASQNIYLVHDGLIDGIKIDLQIIDGEGYNIDKALEAYNCKSVSKVNKPKAVFKVVI